MTTKMMQVLAAIESVSTFAEIANNTGIQIDVVRASASKLKKGGLIERLSPDAPRTEVATYALTDAGRAALYREEQIDEDAPTLPIVQAGIASRHVLAKVWQGACA